MADKTMIAGAIAMIKTSFPNWTTDTTQTAQVWSMLLGDLENTALQTAIIALITEPGRVFAPSIGEIRGQVLKLNALASGIPEAWQAYDEVIKMPGNMKRFIERPEGQPEYETDERGTRTRLTYFIELKFSHKLVESVARMMGWPKAFPTDMPSADRSQFIKAYEAERDRLFSQQNRLKLVSEYVETKRLEMATEQLPLLEIVKTGYETGFYY